MSATAAISHLHHFHNSVSDHGQNTVYEVWSSIPYWESKQSTYNWGYNPLTKWDEPSSKDLYKSKLLAR